MQDADPQVRHDVVAWSKKKDDERELHAIDATTVPCGTDLGGFLFRNGCERAKKKEKVKVKPKVSSVSPNTVFSSSLIEAVCNRTMHTAAASCKLDQRLADRSARPSCATSCWPFFLRLPQPSLPRGDCSMLSVLNEHLRLTAHVPGSASADATNKVRSFGGTLIQKSDSPHTCVDDLTDEGPLSIVASAPSVSSVTAASLAAAVSAAGVRDVAGGLVAGGVLVGALPGGEGGEGRGGEGGRGQVGFLGLRPRHFQRAWTRDALRLIVQIRGRTRLIC